MGHGHSAVKVLDFATDFIPGVNLVKNVSLAIYDAATDDMDGAAIRAVKIFTSAISTATLGAGDEFVLAGDLALAGMEGTAVGEVAQAVISHAPEVAANFIKTQIGSFPITVATKGISEIATQTYKHGTADTATRKDHALHSMQQHAGPRRLVPIEGELHHWKRTPCYAVYKGANWNNLGEIVEKCDLKRALEIAHTKKYPCFFYCWEAMYLEGNANRKFNPGSAVFFRTADERIGTAPQCDLFKLYKKY